MSEFSVIIGLEVHTQLKTESKLFCGCSTEFNPDAPNTQTCPVCLGLPGALPVMNRRAFELAVRTGLALNCTIAEFTKWDRKQYYYPDLPKAYQISQYDLPFSSEGWLDIEADQTDQPLRKIRITRAHLEEDAGKNVHDESGRGGDSGVDLNRTGTPLLEIVSEPDLRSASEARRYLEKLRSLLLFLGVSDCNMQEGSLRCDANINLHIERTDGTVAATPIVELKNMNSFRNVELAIDYEVRRQWKAFCKDGTEIGDAPKSTRGWDADRGVTFPQREKEDSSDYRYFPDPDLVPVTLTPKEIDEFRNALPETPEAKQTRFTQELGLSDYDAAVLIEQGPELTGYFETTATLCGDGKTAANWVTQDVLRDINASGVSPADFPFPAPLLGELLRAVVEGEITNKSGRDIYRILLEESVAGGSITAERIHALASERQIVRDTSAIESAVRKAADARPEVAADVRGGKQQAVGPLIGMVMKEVSGADPKTVRQMLLDYILAQDQTDD